VADAGRLELLLTADQSEFTSGMQKAGNTVNWFGDAAKKSGAGMDKFNASLLMSRNNLHLIGEAAGVSLGAVHHVFAAFESGLGPIAIFVGTLLAAKSAFEAGTEAINAYATGLNKTTDAIRSNSLENMKKRLAEVNTELIKGKSTWEDYANAAIGVAGPIPGMGYILQKLGVIPEIGKERLEEAESQKSLLEKAILTSNKQPAGAGGHGPGHAAIGAIAGGALQAQHSQEVVVLYKILDAVNRNNNNPLPPRAVA